MYTYEYAPYVEFPKKVMKHSLSFITFNKTNYEYKRTIVIKDVKLKYLGVTMYDIDSGVFRGSAFEFNDNIVRSDKFYHLIIDTYVPFLIERRGQCAQHSCDECSACRHHRDKYILFPRATNSTLLTNYYYICDIKFQRDEELYEFTKEEGRPYSSYEPSVEM